MASLKIFCCAVLMLHCGFACGPAKPDMGECTNTAMCAAALTPECDLCPAGHDRICVANTCVDVGQEQVQVKADVWVHFSLSGQVQSIVAHFIDGRRSQADAAPHSCESLLRLTAPISDDECNIVRSNVANFHDTSGTGFFPDAALGSIPTGELLLLVHGYPQRAGQGKNNSSACVVVDLVAQQEVKLDLRLQP